MAEPWELDWDGVAIDGTPAEDAKDPEKERQRQLARSMETDAAIAAINLARTQAVQPRSTGNVFGREGFGYVPILGQNSTNLGATLQGLEGNVIKDVLAQLKELSATGASGFGSLSEKEGARLAAAVASLNQAQSQDELVKALNRVELHYRNAKAILSNEDPRTPEVQDKYGIGFNNAGEFTPPSQRDTSDKIVGAVGGRLDPNATQEDVPLPSGLNERLIGYVNARGGNLSAQEFSDFVNRTFSEFNYPASLTPVAAEQTIKAIQGGAKYGGTQKAKRNLSEADQMLNRAAQSPLGAFAMAGGDAVAAPLAVFGKGSLADWTANPDLARGQMRATMDNNPVASTLGSITGGTAATLGLGMGLAGLGVKGGAAALGADLGYGASYGAAQTPEDPFGGAVTGAAASFLGNRIGNRIGNTLAGSARGVTDPNVATLRSAGVPLTPGRILGGSFAKTEDRLTSNPYVGDTIVDRQMDSYRGFNRAAFNEAGDQLGTRVPAIGQQGMAQLDQASNNAYDAALSQMEFVPDAAFAQRMGQIQRNQATSGVLSNDQLGQVSKNISSNVGGRMRGTAPRRGLFGKSLKKAVSNMRSQGQQMDPAVKNALGEYRTAIMDAARQQSAPEATSLLNAADSAYPFVKTLQQAVGGARNQPENLFTPAQLGTAAYQQTKKFGGQAAASEGRVPFNALQQAGQAVLPSKIPDSGTPSRLLENGGMGIVPGLIARGKAAAVKPFYDPSLQGTIERLLIDRPDFIRKYLGSDFVRGALGGATGAPAALTWMNQ